MDLIRIVTEFATEEACLAYLEKARWPHGVQCVKCDGARISKITTKASKRSKPYVSKRTGKASDHVIPARSLYQCLDCGEQFTAKSGTLFNDSHIPLTKWFLAVTLVTNAKKGMSAKQMQRDLKVSYQTAWHLCHRIRESMQGGASVFAGTVEMDEVYI